VGPEDPSDGGRADALRWAEHLRSVRRALRDQMSAGRVTLAEVLALRGDPAVGAVRLLWVLESRPGARKVDTRRRMAAEGLPESLGLAEMDDAQVAATLSAFAAVEAP
jgi:hypothetical protein